jgi:hypothetical protein
MRSAISFAILLLVTPAWAEQPTTGFYGCPWNADGLANFEIGRQEGRSAAYRFRAAHTGTVDKVMTFLIFRAPGYYAGDGGQVRLELQEDNGTTGHLPSGKALASSLVTDPMKQKWNRMFTFDHPTRLAKGQLYHLVFTNPAPDPVHNYVSVDDLYNRRRTPNMQPGVSDLDLAVLCKLSSKTSWTINYGHTPIFCLYYEDGARQGQGYRDAASQSGVCPIGGEDRVSEVFTVTDGSRAVVSISTRVRKTGDPADLRVQVERADGTLLEEVRISAVTVQDNYGWVTGRFQVKHVLQAGKSYRLVLSAPSGSRYETFPLQDGKAHGFDTPSLFSDGHFEQSSGGSWQRYRGRTDFDMQFYFSLATIGKPTDQ